MRDTDQEMQTSEPLTYSVREVAQILGLSRNSVYQGCEKGQIPHIRIGKRVLIPKTQFERLLLGNWDSEKTNQEPKED